MGDIKVTEEEMELYLVIKNKGDNFKSKLFELICKADHNNMMLLSLGYPEFVKASYRYSSEEGYWDNLVKRVENE